MMSLYTANELLLFPGLVLLGFPGLGFLVINIICVPILGSFATIAIIVFSGTFDASSALFLALSKLDNLSLSTMFGFLAIMSIFSHLRTFFIMPFNLPNEDFEAGNFKKCNIIAKFYGKLDEKTEKKEENEVPLKKSYSSPVFILFLVVYVINNTRVKSLQGKNIAPHREKNLNRKTCPLYQKLFFLNILIKKISPLRCQVISN